MRRFLWNLATDRRGIALVTILALMGVLSALAATYTLAIRADTALRGGAARERTSFYAAEAGLNNAMGEVHEYFEDYTAPGNYSNTIVVSAGAHARSVTYSVNEVPGHNPGPPTQIAVGQPFAGLNTIPYDYTVSSVAKMWLTSKRPDSAHSSRLIVSLSSSSWRSTKAIWKFYPVQTWC